MRDQPKQPYRDCQKQPYMARSRFGVPPQTDKRSTDDLVAVHFRAECNFVGGDKR